MASSERQHEGGEQEYGRKYIGVLHFLCRHYFMLLGETSLSMRSPAFDAQGRPRGASPKSFSIPSASSLASKLCIDKRTVHHAYHRLSQAKILAKSGFNRGVRYQIKSFDALLAFCARDYMKFSKRIYLGCAVGAFLKGNRERTLKKMMSVMVQQKMLADVCLTLHSAMTSGIYNASGIEIFTRDPASAVKLVVHMGLLPIHQRQFERLKEDSSLDGENLRSFAGSATDPGTIGGYDILIIVPKMKDLIFSSSKGKDSQVLVCDPIINLWELKNFPIRGDEQIGVFD